MADFIGAKNAQGQTRKPLQSLDGAMVGTGAGYADEALPECAEVRRPAGNQPKALPGQEKARTVAVEFVERGPIAGGRKENRALQIRAQMR